MNWREFVVEMTRSLAWPVVVAWLFYLYRVPVRRILRTLNSVLAKVGKISFKRGENAVVLHTDEAIEVDTEIENDEGDS